MRVVDRNNLESFRDFLQTDKVLMIPILSDRKRHWINNRVSFVYYFGLGTFEEWIVGFTHNDCYFFTESFLSDFKCSGQYVYRKKYLVDCGANHEAELAFWFETNTRLGDDVDFPTTILDYHRRFSHKENVNDFIPIMKWLEYCQDIKDRFVLKCTNFIIDEPFIKYEQLLDDLVTIEKNGLFTKQI